MLSLRHVAELDVITSHVKNIRFAPLLQVLERLEYMKRYGVQNGHCSCRLMLKYDLLRPSR